MGGVQNRVRGVLLGLAAGDRNGGPIRMAVRLAESLTERRCFDPDDILARYLAWWRVGAFDTGPTTGTVLSLINGGSDPVEAVWRAHEQAGGMTAGCNPAHRCAPLAMAFYLPDDELAGCASREARLTHQDPLAGDVAAAVAVLCRSLIRGSAWDDAVSRAATGRLRQTAQALDLGNPAPLSPGGFAPEVLRAVVQFVTCQDSFVDALNASLRFAGPANYCPVLVGAIAGARCGATATSPAMFAGGNLVSRVRGAADRLANDWGNTA